MIESEVVLFGAAVTFNLTVRVLLVEVRIACEVVVVVWEGDLVLLLSAFSNDAASSIYGLAAG